MSRTLLIAVLSFSLGFAGLAPAPVQAQDTTERAVTVADEDRDMDWGWLGLLGLLGLAGLRRREPSQTHTTMPPAGGHGTR